MPVDKTAQQLIDVLESMSDAVFMLDEAWHIIRVNRVQEKISQTKRKDTLGKNFWKVFPAAAEPASKYWTEYHKVMKTRQTAHFVEYYEPLKLWTEVDVYPAREGGISVFFRDITEEKRRTESLAASEARLSFMAESLPQKIFTATPEGKVDYFNSQWTKYTGVPMTILNRDGVRHLVHPDDLPESMRTWRLAITTGKPFQNEQRLLRSDGHYRRHVSHVVAMKDDKGKVTRWFGSMTDIEDITRTTARKKQLEQTTAALREQRAQLIELNAAKDEFISLASHQLRTPATGVKQYLGMVLDGFAGDVSDGQRKMLDQAYLSNEREIIIINDLLKVAQVDAGKVKLKKQLTDIGLLVQQILDDQSSKFSERRQQVKLTGHTDDIKVRADTNRLRMVLENIIDNASKYSPPGKSVEVRVTRSPEAVTIAVRDQGVGIDEQDIGKLFRKFSRLDNPLSVAVGGTGLGLYWAKKIIDLHGGTIELASTVHKGSTFTVTLPA